MSTGGGFNDQPGFGQQGPSGRPGQGAPGQYGQSGWPGPGAPGQGGQQGWPGSAGPQYPYGQPDPYAQPGAPWQSMPRRTNSLAIAALCCAIGQVIAGPFAGIPAVVLGSMSLKQIRQTGEDGNGMAMTGIVLGIIGTLLFVVIIIFFIAFWHHVNSQFNNVNNFNP